MYQIIGKAPTEFANLTKTEELRSWLNRLSNTVDYQTGGNLQKAYNRLLKPFEMVIKDASAPCGDRVALSILHLNVAYQLATIDLKDMKKLADFLV